MTIIYLAYISKERTEKAEKKKGRYWKQTFHDLIKFKLVYIGDRKKVWMGKEKYEYIIPMKA